MSNNDKKAWIKQYRAEHNCSLQEAQNAFDTEYKYDVMTRKEAKAWIKDHMEQTGCSKKEAKAAFEEQFGYKVPLNRLQKFLRYSSVLIAAPILGSIDNATGGKLGFEKYLSGTGNNDTIYQKRT